MASARKRIVGWFFFDWASQPYHTLLLTFIFGPFFAAIATEYFMGTGLDEMAADARAQSVWSTCLTITGLMVAIAGPIMGATADTSGRRMPWIVGFSVLAVFGSTALWWTNPDGSNLFLALMFFGIAFIGAEFALIFTNAQLPGLGTKEEIGKISGSGFAFGYFGGLVALAIALVLLVEQANGKTLVGMDPIFGLDADAREGTRAVGPFVALWYILFMIPYFLWVREVRLPDRKAHFGTAMRNLASSLAKLRNRPSLASFLGGSMLYRDALNGLYGFGGTYGVLVLNWSVPQIGAFGIAGGLSAAIFSFIGGRIDAKIGPKPVIIAAILGLAAVCFIIVNMSRESFFGLTLSEGSKLPDTVFYVCGVVIGGFGGVLQAASRTLMVRHANPDAPTESFGLYGFAGRATAFLAPALIGLATFTSGDVRMGVLPLIFLFLLGLVLLRWVQPDGDRAEQWSDTSSQHS